MFEILGLECRSMTVVSAVGPGNMLATLFPTEGEIWLVCRADGYHDNAGALSGQWAFGSTAAPKVLDPGIAHASTDRISCYSKSPLSANAHIGQIIPFRVGIPNYLQWTVSALLAGERAYIDAVIYVLRGVRRQQS